MHVFLYGSTTLSVLRVSTWNFACYLEVLLGWFVCLDGFNQEADVDDSYVL